MFSIPVPFDSLALVYVGRIVFESDISLRRIRRVEFRGNSHEEYYRSVRPPSLSSLLLPLLFLHFSSSLSRWPLLYVPTIEIRYFNRSPIWYVSKLTGECISNVGFRAPSFKWSLRDRDVV